jgi:uncharacterized delta-60 repeat protein
MANDWRKARLGCFTRMATTIAALLVSAFAWAGPGDPDLTFNATGSFGPFSFTTGAVTPRAMALQPDGRIVVAGYCEKSSSDSDTDFCVLRLNRDGTLDTSFTGPSGTAAGFFTLALGYPIERLAAVRLQSDGKIVLAGTCGSSGTSGVFCLARLNTNGALDNTFDGPFGSGNGFFEISFGSGPLMDTLVDMAIQADDKIVVAGTCRPSIFDQFCVARLNGNTGSFDTSFDGPDAAGTGVGTGNGRFVRSIVSTSTEELMGALMIQADGRIVLGGACGSVPCMMRLLATNGSFDPSFDGPSSPAGNGRWARSLSTSSTYVRGIVEVLADGTTTPHILIAFVNATGAPPDYAIGLLTSTGSVSSGLTGMIGLDGSAIRNLVELPTNEVTRWIEAAGQRLLLGIGQISKIARFTPGFGPGWGLERSRELTVTPVFFGGINATLQQPDGRVIVLGRAAVNTLLVKRLEGGPYDCGGDFDGDGRVLATTDSLIGMRVALGMNTSAVIAGINFPVGATRTTWPAIRDYLIQSCGIPLTQ